MCTYLDQVGSTYYFRRVVPTELRPFILTRTGKPRTEWKISLRTKDQREAKRQLPAHTIVTDDEIDAARRALGRPVPNIPETPAGQLSARATAYVDQMTERDLEGAEIAFYESVEKEERYEARTAEREALRARVRDLRSVDLPMTEQAMRDLLRERDEAVDRVQAVIGEREMSRLADALPSSIKGVAKEASQSSKHPTEPQPLLDLFDAYAKEQGMKAITVQDWGGVLRSLVRFLGHDDAARFSVEDIDRWRDFLLSETTKRGALRSPRTVKDKYLSALRSTLNYAVGKRKLPENVASRVVVRTPRQPKFRDRDFTNDEAKAILAATLRPHTDAPELTQRARRWIPWLCAYTGARVNEISQLRGADVAKKDGIWTIHITPEAGTVKSGEARVVPLHPHLIEQGFVAFADKAGSGALFYDPSRVRKPGAANRHVTKVGERLAAWVRDMCGITDPNVSPNHAWRHLFKTRAIEAGMPERVADAILGHAARSVGQTYGRVSLEVANEAIGSLPRFETA